MCTVVEYTVCAEVVSAGPIDRRPEIVGPRFGVGIGLLRVVAGASEITVQQARCDSLCEQRPRLVGGEISADKLAV